MPAPPDFSYPAGRAHVYRAYLPGDTFTEDGAWSVQSVSQSVLGKPATATLAFNRAQLISGEPNPLAEPVVYFDARFRIAFREAGQPGGILVFEGTPANLKRTDSGTPSAKISEGVLHLEGATEFWTRSETKTIIGSRFARIADQTQETEDNFITRDTGVPCVFNPNGLPNRSYETTENSGFFAEGDAYISRGPIHHFLSPAGYGLYRDGNTIIKRARYWTFAQAIAYLLWWEAQANSSFPSGEITGLLGFKMSFGAPPGSPSSSDDEDMIWRVIEPFIEIEPAGEPYEAQDPVNPAPFTDPAQFSIDPLYLLSTRVPGISVEGMPVLHAIDKLLSAAGLRAWVDTLKTFVDIHNAPDGLHKIKVTSPGGKLNDPGFGRVFIPKLDPYKAPRIDAEEAPAFFARNNTKDIDVAFDFKGTVTRPLIVRGPTRYEITAELRPGWGPIHPLPEGGGSSYEPVSGYPFIDNINAARTVVDPGNSPGINELSLATAEAVMAFQVFRSNPDLLLQGPSTNQPEHVLKRLRFLANSLVKGGSQASPYQDVLRKWILPTDDGYDDEFYARDITIVAIPQEWGHYNPINFATGKSYDGSPASVLHTVLTSDIIEAEISPELRTGVGAEGWPARARPFLPCLVRDRNKQSPGVIVEISFDSGDSWYRFDSIRVAGDESAIWLEFQNPFDVLNPKASVESASSNLFLAYLNHRFRVRVTCVIEGSDPVYVRPNTSVQQGNEAQVAQVFDRRQRYRREVLASKHVTQVVTDYAQLPDVIDPDSLDTDGLLKPDTAVYVFQPANPRQQMIRDADRIRTYRTGRKVQASLVIPWIETDATPGCVVPRIDGRAANAGETDRSMEFEDETAGGDKLAPMVVGVTYHFEGRYETELVLEDWRAARGIP